MVYLFKKIKNGKICWYLGESKRANGKVRRTWQKYLGTAENVGEALKHGIFPKETDVLEFGLCAALLKIDNEIQFKDTFDRFTGNIISLTSLLILFFFIIRQWKIRDIH